MFCIHSRLRRHLSVLCLTMLVAPHALAGKWQQNLSIGGFSKVHIYTPDSTSPIGEGRALLIVLHGCLQPIEAYLSAQLEMAAEDYGMVIAVPDAMNKAGFGCWSYWQGAISRTEGDYKNLIDLAETLATDQERAIDVDQVYLTGLSSGGSFAAQAGCLAPDLFAGVAASAAPSIGTSSAGAVARCEAVSPTLFKTRCVGYAGSNASLLATQIAVLAHGDADRTVNLCYNKQNAEGFAMAYGVSPLPGSNIITEEAGRRAEEHLWQNGRVAMLWLNGLGHEWSAGSGASGSFISPASIDFARYIGQHFAENNQRVDRNRGPEIVDLSVTTAANSLAISGYATDAEGYVSSVLVTVIHLDDGSEQLADNIDRDIDGTGQFFATSSHLADGLYRVEVVGVDDQGKLGESAAITQRLGPEPPPQPPLISDLAIRVNGDCATVTGTAVDLNHNLTTVTVRFEDDLRLAPFDSVTGNFEVGKCGLTRGPNTATVTAQDETGLSSQRSLYFEVQSGITGDYVLHMNMRHIRWGDGVFSCYLAFADQAFTMRERATDDGMCIWQADGAPSCFGPKQSCANGDGNDMPRDPDECPLTSDGAVACEPPPDAAPEEQCQQVNSYNYYHKLAARAFSDGNYWNPSYFAAGSNAPIPGSTWGWTTLRSTDGLTWRPGPCL